jgi:hypothetical protein
MDRTAKMSCPYCGTSLKSERGVRVGRQIFCPRCGASFTVQADEDGPARAPAPFARPPAAAARLPGGVNGARLALAVGGVLLYLAAGAALGYYCFTRGAPKADTHQGSSGKPTGDKGAPPARPPTPPRPTVAVSPADRVTIDNAVVKGVWYLKEHQLPSGSWSEDLAVGYATLPGLTLLECGASAGDPVVQKAAAFVRAQAPQLVPDSPYDTYQVALSILFLDRLGDRKDKQLIQHLALRLVAGQRPDDGGWSYKSAPIGGKDAPQLLRLLKDDNTPLDQWRQNALKGVEFDPGQSDNSNTQFAVLALWVARRHDVPIERTAALVGQRFRDSQLGDAAGADLDGGWYYTGETFADPWPTMTCSGLLGLAVAGGAAKDGAPAADKDRVRRAFAQLSRSIDRPGEDRTRDLYFLWSLERVGVLYDLPKIEDKDRRLVGGLALGLAATDDLARIMGKDWYAWGRKPLLARQAADGHWQDGGYNGAKPVPNTCFALLFLKQANLAKDLTAKLRLLERK